jgi:hypothetical protein
VLHIIIDAEDQGKIRALYFFLKGKLVFEQISLLVFPKSTILHLLPHSRYWNIELLYFAMVLLADMAFSLRFRQVDRLEVVFLSSSSIVF